MGDFIFDAISESVTKWARKTGKPVFGMRHSTSCTCRTKNIFRKNSSSGWLKRGMVKGTVQGMADSLENGGYEHFDRG